MHRTALACSLIALATGPSLAQDHQGLSASAGRDAIYTSAPITHTAPPSTSVTVGAPTLAVWSADLSRLLRSAARYPSFASNEMPAEGVARVRFSCSESGAPTDAKIALSSGNHRLDKAALATVRRIKTLHPLPVGVAHDQRYVAVLVFATSPQSFRRQMRMLRSRAATRDGGSGRDVVLFTAAGGFAG